MAIVEGTVERRASWTWIQRLLLIGGVTGLIGLVVLVVLVEADIFFLLLGIPLAGALWAYWELRRDNRNRAWWISVIVGALSLVLELLSSGYMPVVRPVMDLVQFFSPRELAFFVMHAAYITLVVAGVWALVAHLQDKSAVSAKPPRTGPVPTLLYDAEGNPVAQTFVVQTSPLAIVAFILVWFFTPVGLILGYVALNDIRRSQGTKSGEGLAKASITLGWVFLVVSAIAIAVIVANG